MWYILLQFTCFKFVRFQLIDLHSFYLMKPWLSMSPHTWLRLNLALSNKIATSLKEEIIQKVVCKCLMNVKMNCHRKHSTSTFLLFVVCNDPKYNIFVLLFCPHVRSCDKIWDFFQQRKTGDTSIAVFCVLCHPSFYTFCFD